MPDTNMDTELVTLTADIVSAHVANNAVHTGEIAALIATGVGFYFSMKHSSALKSVEVEQKKFENRFRRVNLGEFEGSKSVSISSPRCGRARCLINRRNSYSHLV